MTLITAEFNVVVRGTNYLNNQRLYEVSYEIESDEIVMRKFVLKRNIFRRLR